MDRHTAAPPEVWLTTGAVEDLERLDGAALVWALKKMLLLETSSEAGEPLMGNLIGFRKLLVSDRDWRIVWRPTTNDRGGTVIEVSEVWAVGARSDNDVYAEMSARLAAAPKTPSLKSLSAVVEALGRRGGNIVPRRPYEAPAAPPPWLVERLLHTVGLDRADVLQMTLEQAVDAWTDYRLRSR
jgi:mRNA interferase RelE/StbE